MPGPYMPGAGQNGTSGWLESGDQPYSTYHYEDLISSAKKPMPNPYSTLNSSYSASNSGKTVSAGYGGSGYSVASSFGGGYGDYLDMLKQISKENNAFNLEQVKMVNEFNAAEALKNREWQERMSRNAHQYEVEDLIKAGLNPVLSAGGNGATVGSGAVASGQKAIADNTYGQGVMHMMTAAINAASAERVASIYTAASMHNQSMYLDVLRNNNTASNLSGIFRTLLGGVQSYFYSRAASTRAASALLRSIF